VAKTRPRRVALVTSSFHPHTGGVEEHVRHVAREMSQRGVRVEVWTVDRGEGLREARVDGVRVRYLPTPLPARDGLALMRFLGSVPAALWMWWRAFTSLRPEVLHVHCFGPNGVYALALHRLTRTPLVVTSHGETFADDHGVYDRSALLRSALRQSIDAAVAVTGPTQFVLRDLRARFGLVDGQVVPNGVDETAPPVESLELPTGRPMVLAVGRLERMKGFDLLLDAAAHPELDAVHVVIGGDGSQSSALHRRAQDLGIADRVHFLGRVTPGQVTAAMAAADVVVVPSRREAFGIVALEAWRAGTPLVGTVHGGMPDFVEDGVDGLLVDPAVTLDLVAAVARVIDDVNLVEHMCRSGRDRLGDFMWSAVVDKYVSAYEDLS
jgi:glycosyltransferase involved in cell wall biosynthesis